MFNSDKLDTNLNLTPMIDVMSVMVAFLLMTAVWQQISAINSFIETRGPGIDVPVTLPKNDRVEVRVTDSGHQLLWPPMVTRRQRVPGEIMKSSVGYDLDGITAVFKALVSSKINVSVSVTGDDMVKYGVVAETIDAIKLGGITEVALATN